MRTETTLRELCRTLNGLKLLRCAPWSLSKFYVLQLPHPVTLNVAPLLTLSLLQSVGRHSALGN